MNILVFYSTIILTLIRIIGLGLSLGLFLETRSPRFKIFTPGWSLCIISPYFSIIAEFEGLQDLSDVLLVFCTSTLLLGMYCIILGMILYLRHIPKRLIIVFAFVMVLLPMVLLFISGIEAAFSITSLMFFLLFMCIFISFWLARNDLTDKLGNSRYWFIGALIFSFFYIINAFITALQGYSFGLYYVDNAEVIIRYYFFVIGVSILIAFLQINIEQSVSYNHKFQLKDIYSHNLGNIMQIILNTIEFEEESINKELIKRKCIEAGDLIKEIREI